MNMDDIEQCRQFKGISFQATWVKKIDTVTVIKLTCFLAFGQLVAKQHNPLDCITLLVIQLIALQDCSCMRSIQC